MSAIAMFGNNPGRTYKKTKAPEEFRRNTQ
jgi:hypothetical protein